MAIILLWGAHEPAPYMLALTVAWTVNATLYSLVAWGILTIFKISSRDTLPNGG